MRTETPSRTTATENEANTGSGQPGGFIRWHRRVLAFCLIIFALELGLFLVIFPWRPEWELNWVPVNMPKLFSLWMNHYFRGAISGLGSLNVWVALAELYRQLKAVFGSRR